MKDVVCFFINNVSNSGGTERVSSIIANQLARHQYPVLIVSLFSDNNRSFFDLDANIKIRTIFQRPTRGLYSFPVVFFRLRKLLAEYDVDIVVNVDSILATYTIPVCYSSRKRIRNICWEHFNYQISLGKSIRRFSRTLASRYCDDVITLTERDRSFWIEHNPDLRNIVAISNPALHSDTEPARDKVGDKLLIAVGRLTRQKGFDLLIKAFRLVIRHRRDWKLDIIGDGEEREALGALIDELDLADYIRLVPATKQIDEMYRRAGLFVMSSRFEGLPMVLLEAASFGLPIVSFDCDTGPAEVITNESGWLCRPNDITALAETIVHAMGQCDDPVVYGRYSHNALVNSSRFTVDAVTDKWLKLLER